jgi:hypothetical protein
MYALFNYHRLTPAYAFVIFYLASAHHLLIIGPFWDLAASGQKRCAEYWWANLLYITNYYKNFEAPVIKKI